VGPARTADAGADAAPLAERDGRGGCWGEGVAPGSDQAVAGRGGVFSEEGSGGTVRHALPRDRVQRTEGFAAAEKHGVRVSTAHERRGGFRDVPRQQFQSALWVSVWLSKSSFLVVTILVQIQVSVKVEKKVEKKVSVKVSVKVKKKEEFSSIEKKIGCKNCHTSLPKTVGAKDQPSPIFTSATTIDRTPQSEENTSYRLLRVSKEHSSTDQPSPIFTDRTPQQSEENASSRLEHPSKEDQTLPISAKTA